MTQKTARIIVGLIKASTPIFKKSKLLHFPRPYITKWPNYTQRKCPINWWIMILFAMVWRHNFILLTHGWTSMTKIEIQWPILIFPAWILKLHGYPNVRLISSSLTAGCCIFVQLLLMMMMMESRIDYDALESYDRWLFSSYFSNIMEVSDLCSFNKSKGKGKATLLNEGKARDSN